MVGVGILVSFWASSVSSHVVIEFLDIENCLCALVTRVGRVSYIWTCTEALLLWLNWLVLGRCGLISFYNLILSMGSILQIAWLLFPAAARPWESLNLFWRGLSLTFVPYYFYLSCAKVRPFMKLALGRVVLVWKVEHSLSKDPLLLAPGYL